MDQFSVRNAASEASVEQSRIAGDYYRDLSTNYYDYSVGLAPWPMRPHHLRHLDD